MTVVQLSPNNLENQRLSRGRNCSTISFLPRRRTMFRPGSLLSPALKQARAEGSAMSRRREKEAWWLPEQQDTVSEIYSSLGMTRHGKLNLFPIHRTWPLP